MPTFLSRLGSLLRRCDPDDLSFVPTIAALHTMYANCHMLSQQVQVNPEHLAPYKTSQPVWDRRTEDVIETVLGMVSLGTMIQRLTSRSGQCWSC